MQIGSVDSKILQVGNFGATSCNGDSGGPALVTIDGGSTRPYTVAVDIQ